MSERINTYNEGSLHAALKLRYAAGGGRVEVEVDGYIVDVVRGDQLVEIQTSSFSSAKGKLEKLVENHRLLLVHPIPQKTWIVKAPRPDEPDSQTLRRRSPKRGSVLMLFDQLVSFPKLIAHPNFTIDVVLTLEDQLRHYDGKRGWRRRGWVVDERVLLAVVETYRFSDPRDLAKLLPNDLPEGFTTADIASALRLRRRLAQRMAYCLREVGLIEEVERRRRGIVYRRAVPQSAPH